MVSRIILSNQLKTFKNQIDVSISKSYPITNINITRNITNDKSCCKKIYLYLFKAWPEMTVVIITIVIYYETSLHNCTRTEYLIGFPFRL